MAYGIDEDGSVVGASITPTGVMHAFVWSEKGGMQDLGARGVESRAFAVRGGQVAGISGAEPQATPARWSVADVNLAPVAVVANGTRFTIKEGQGVTWSSAGTRDGDGDPLAFLWTFNDGTLARTQTVTRSYNDQGEWHARLLVTDPSGAADTVYSAVTVTNVAPRATFVSPVAVPVNTGFQISLTQVIEPSPVDRRSLQYAFDCGGGYDEFWRSEATVSCYAVAMDTITVRAKVRDKDGGQTEYTRRLIVTNYRPTVAATLGQQTTAKVGELVALGGYLEDRADPGPWAYEVAWGDRQFSRGTVAGTIYGASLPPELGHRYTTPGTYTISVSVRDPGGLTGRAAPLTITIVP